jgi:phthiocerol/phenolphthiocerol synthesis type-I polyketide synthase C
MKQQAGMETGQGPEIKNEPIAIIGMGCRYPQAAGLDALWQLLLEGRDVIAPYPGGRFRDLDSIYEEAAAGSRAIATHLGGFLPEIDRFDAAFFGISPREAGFLDPQQRLLLEVTWNALEDAGQLRENYEGSRTGVFTGLWTEDYEDHIYRNSERPELYLLTGGARSTVSGRLSFAFGFEGPSMSVDTACSSSMVTIHLACQSLRQRECDMALAGGVNLVLAADVTRSFTTAGMLSSDGRCRFGDQSASGFVRSEGAGMVVLKRLSDAIADGDGIYAVIRGSSVNSDGRSSGLLVRPSRSGQEAMLLEAWKQAGIIGSDLSYIEAHGTGTQAGDSVEVGAICDALKKTGAQTRIPIGSMKTNIGHTESAAGVAGVIKIALVLQNGVIPGSLHYKTPNPNIDWENLPVEIVQGTRPLPPASDGKPRMVGASSFGISGTNSHMVLAEHVVSGQDGDAVSEDTERPSSCLLPLSGYTSEALLRNARNWASILDQNWQAEDVAEICYLSGARRTPLAHRFTAVGRDAAELQTQLEAFIAGESSASPEAGVAGNSPVRVVFVAPGQGSQWDGMARDLLRGNATFRESLTACDRAIAVETGWSLIERLEGPDAARFLGEIDFVQPALFAMSVALAAVWRAAGVTPGAVIGHSMGEVAAAYLAGVLTLEDAAAVICRRSRLMRTLCGSGAMASIELTASEVDRWIEPFAGKISIAAENSPGTTVVAGETEAIDQLLEWLELKEIFCRRIKVDVASHSTLVDPILPALAEQLAHLQPMTGTLPFFSTVNGALTDGSALDAKYWVRNLRQPVRLATATAALARDGFTCFIELSPHPILMPALENTLRNTATGSDSGPAIALPSLVRGNPAYPALLRSYGRFWIHGGQLDWATVTGRPAGPVSHRFRLPDYAFERERFWPEEAESADVQARSGASRLSPLLLSRTDPSNDLGTSVFTVIADIATLPYLTDHRVGGAIVFPATAHLEAALEAAHSLAPGKFARLANISFPQALYLSETEAQEVQLVTRRIPGKADSFTFALMGRQGGGEGEWTEHSTGTIHQEETPFAVDSPTEGQQISDSGLQDAAVRQGSGEEHYRKARRSGLQYGPAFQLIESFTSGNGSGRPSAQMKVRLSDNVFQKGYFIHPALLDNCFQAILHLRPEGVGMSADDVYLPLMLRGLKVFGSSSQYPVGRSKRLVTEAVFSSMDAGAATMNVELRLRTEDGQMLAVVEAMTVQRVKTRGGEKFADNLFAMIWKPLLALPAPTPGGSAGVHWLIFAESGPGVDASASYAAALARRHASFAGRCSLVWQGERFRPLGDGERRLDLLGADEYELPIGDRAALDTLLGLVAAEAGRISDVIDLWTLNGSAADADVLDGILGAQHAGAKFVPTLVQAITRAAWTHPPRLWLATSGTQDLPDAPPSANLAGATVWGLGAALSREHPELRPSLIDFSGVSDRQGPHPEEIESAVRLLMHEHTHAEGNAGVIEDRVALRGGQAFAERLVPCPVHEQEQELRPLASGEAYRVETERPGSLDQLQLRAITTAAPAEGEVTIEIACAGLNFIDVTKAMGIYPGLDPKAPVQMGNECSGRILAVGAGVEGLRIGDEVVALTPSPTRVGLLASRANVPAALTMRRPARLSLAEVASLPLAYLTAHYSLNELGRMRRGEWVLIHAGAGGVGLAAASIALAQRARVIATASSPEKHAFLYEWGVEHVLPSRSLDFAEGVMEITGGRGVDIVLNSLTGDFITKSLDVLAPYGRFIEIGKRDIYADKRVGLRAFRNNIAYFAVDLAALIEEKPEYAAEMLREVMEAVETGRWAVLPVTDFPAENPAEAFHFMAQGRHIGKLVLQFENIAGEMRVLPPRLAGSQTLFRKDAAYVITGGLGGVGAAVAEWMAANGAGHLVLVSRRAAGVQEKELFEHIRALGAVVEHHRTDLLDLPAVEKLMAELASTMPPVRGIMHAAAVIDDALVNDLTPDRFDAVYGPKIRGTWHMHQATSELSLDFFVMFSSIASIFPQPGHGSYSAANSFLDAFAGYRRGLGLPASSINWAGWLRLGLAREMGTTRTLDVYDVEGFGNFERDQALQTLGEALRANPVQALAARLDMETLASTQEKVPSLLRELLSDRGQKGARQNATGGSEHPALEEVVAAATYGEKLLRIEALLRTETSRVLKLAPDRIAANQLFGQMGVDSLMALEFIRRVNSALGLALAATAVFNYPTIHALAVQVAKRLGLSVDEEAGTQLSTKSMDNGVSSYSRPEPAFESVPVQELSEEDALRALMEPLMEPGDSAIGD